jgi:hypothetical protein
MNLLNTINFFLKNKKTWVLNLKLQIKWIIWHTTAKSAKVGILPYDRTPPMIEHFVDIFLISSSFWVI